MRIDVSGIASEEASILLPEGQHHVKILKAAHKVSQSGNDMIQLILKPLDDEYALCDNLFHYMLFPKEVDEMAPEEEKAKAQASNRFRRLDMKNLLESTGIDYDDSGFDLDDLAGAETTVIVGHEESDRGVQARVKRFITEDD